MSWVAGWRAPRTAVVVSLLGVLLSGCIEFRFESEFDADLSARHFVQTTIERAGYEQLEAMGGEGGDIDVFGNSEEIEQEARELGLEYEQIDNDEYIGWRVGKSVSDSRDVGAAINEIFQISGDDDDSSMSDLFSGTIEKDGDTYRLSMLATPSDVTEGSEAETEDLGLDPGMIFSFVYIVTMPGKITETNGTIIGDNQVQWDLPVSAETGQVELLAVSEGSGGGGASSMLIIGGIVALALIGGGAAYYLLTQRQRQPAPIGAAPAAGVAPMAAGAGAFSSEPIHVDEAAPNPSPDDNT